MGGVNFSMPVIIRLCGFPDAERRAGTRLRFPG
jgi:hypothetical protein